MSNTAFTEGPWEVIPKTTVKNIVKMNRATKNKFDAAPHAAIGGFPDDNAKEEIEANAYLIAESPAMYAMLDELIKLGTELLSVDEITDEEDAATVHSNFNDQVINAEKLLSKIRGE